MKMEIFFSIFAFVRFLEKVPLKGSPVLCYFFPEKTLTQLNINIKIK
jgi:hypothetical protein